MPRRITLLCISLAFAGLAVFPANASADQYDQQIQALQAQANALSQQIASLEQQSSAALGAAVSLQQELASTQGQLSAAQLQLAAANQRLATTSRNLQDTVAALTRDRHQLARLVVGLYEVRSDGTATAALVDSKSFLDAMDTVMSLGQVSDRMQSLVDDVRTKQQQLVTLRAQQQQQQQQATAAVSQLQGLEAQENAQQQQYQQQSSSLSGSASALVQQLHSVEAQIAQLRAEQAAAQETASGGDAVVVDGGLPPFAFGPQPDYFPWGQCTWYVASLRDVTWSGDAWQWAGAAAAAGRPEGMTPRTGAIVVFGRGGAYSQYGHVAYVVGVQGPSAFTVDESNYVGLGIIDQRQVETLSGVEAFVY